MADGTGIAWTEATWNVITGCSVVSPGCANCYAMKLAGTRLRDHRSRAGLTKDTKAGPVWNGKVRFNEEWLDQPLRWRKPRMIFVVAHGDLFHESVPYEWLDRVIAVMAKCPQHVFQLLTKRADRMQAYMTALGWLRPLPNLWFGVSVEDQQRADERVPFLLATPAAVRWLSVEPQLGPVDLRNVADGIDALSLGLDWVVSGGESGDRVFDLAWARDLRDQCESTGTAFFMKQLGSCPYSRADRITHPGNKLPLQQGFNRYLKAMKGDDPSEWPSDLRVRQYPQAA